MNGGESHKSSVTEVRGALFIHVDTINFYFPGSTDEIIVKIEVLIQPQLWIIHLNFLAK